jgi:hypothetical protein
MRFVIVGLAALLLVPVGYVLRFPPGPRPLCHRAFEGAFQEWMLASGNTKSYPNVDGKGTASLALIQRYFGDEIQEYGCVPGLRRKDPDNLVFMYLKKKTRHSWHADTRATFFTPPAMDGAVA